MVFFWGIMSKSKVNKMSTSKFYPAKRYLISYILANSPELTIQYNASHKTLFKYARDNLGIDGNKKAIHAWYENNKTNKEKKHVLAREKRADYMKLKANKKALKKALSDKRLENNKTDFYTSKEWRRLRYRVLIDNGRMCQCCGARPPKAVLHVDHIKPRSIYPELELDYNNLQVLCEECNIGKSNLDKTDLRDIKLVS